MLVDELMSFLQTCKPDMPVGLQICFNGVSVNISGDAADLDITYGKDDAGKRNVFLKIDGQSILNFKRNREEE